MRISRRARWTLTAAVIVVVVSVLGCAGMRQKSMAPHDRGLGAPHFPEARGLQAPIRVHAISSLADIPIIHFLLGNTAAGAKPHAPVRAKKLREEDLAKLGVGEELWVIAKGDTPRDAPDPRGTGKAEKPFQGELRALVGAEKKQIPLPLKHTDVKAEISAFIATVNVTQQYHNPYDEKIEAVYVFPLPENAAVTDFVMIVGKRKIRGLIRERKEAERIYKAALILGYVASLLTQERPNIFTQKVANIEPNKSIDVRVSYFHTLKYAKGEYEFVFPMVVGPRFNPPGSTKGIGAVAIGRYGSSGQSTEVGYLKPGMRSGHDIAVQVDIDAGVAIEKAYSRSHDVEVKRVDESKIRVTLKPGDTIPNKDFVLRYQVAGKRLKTALLTHRGKHGKHFALVLQPPEQIGHLPRIPREMVFVLDCSGSMSGWPLKKSKEAMRGALEKLNADDTFQIIRFSDRTSQLGAKPVPATPANKRRGLKYLKSLRGGGGTMMIEGIKAALDFPHDQRRLRIVSFLTDGYIGNEARILGAIREKLGASRIFSFGVGSSPNRHLLDRMARVGRGAVAYVGLHDPGAEVADEFYERAAHPALADVTIDWGGLTVSNVYPRRIPDLFAGRPVLITGRVEGEGKTTVRIRGRAGNEPIVYEVEVDLSDESAKHRGITSLWARHKLTELSLIEAHQPSPELKDEITDVSLLYGVQCRYTAFLAVDASRTTAGSGGTTVAVPVPVPQGVRFDTTVGR